MSNKPTNIWGRRYTVQRIGRVHQTHFKNRGRALEFMWEQWDGGGDWFVAQHDRLGRSKIIMRTDRR